VGGPAPPPPKQAAPPPNPAPTPKRADRSMPTKTEFLPGRNAAALVFDVAAVEPARSVPDLPPGPRRAPPPAPAIPVAPAAPSPPPRPAPLLIDVTPHSLGVETVGGFCDVLIDANTPVPCDRTRAFTTATAGQTTVQVRVAQGESERFAQNTFLGEVELSGLTAAGRGETQIVVTFEIDADGILNVRAQDSKTGQQTTARIQLVGTQTDPRAIEAMRARQAAHPLAALESSR
jgi:molecular chaperone DnaK